MSNQSEIDYDKQFQDDLAKATALSLEQQALDDYRRAKKYGNASNYYNERAQSQSPSLQPSHSVHQRQQSNESALAFYSQLRTRYQQTRVNSNETTTIAPPIPPNRRHSEANNNVSLNVAAVTAASRERSKTPPATLPESDLISFSSPTAKEAQPNTFEKLIEDLQKFQIPSTQTALVPLGPVAAAPITPMHAATGYRGTPPPPQQTMVTPTHNNALYAPAGALGGVAGGAASSMQLVPFTPSPAQQQKVPLTGEELQKLYNMPLHQQQQQQQQARYYHHQQQQHMPAIMSASGIYPPTHMGFVPQMGGYGITPPAINFSQSAPSSAAASAAFTPPQFPPTVSPHYGFQYAGATPYCGSSASSQISGSTQIPLAKSQSAAASIISNGSNSSVAVSALRRQTPPARKPQRTGKDLIDLSQEDDSRVSVLEAFDPLLNTDESVWKK